MDIAALSAVMMNSQVRQQVNVAVAAKVMDSAKVQGAEMARMLEQSVTPNLGKSIDVRL